MTLAQVYRQEGLQEGLQEGRQEGLQEGLQKGQLNTLRESVLDLLRNRFQQVPDGLVESVGEIADLDKLRALLLRAANAADVEDFAKDL